jgi:glycosyltransferase involved in cell wall biosynthesis
MKVFAQLPAKKTKLKIIDTESEGNKAVVCLANSCIHVSGRDVRSTSLSGGDVRFIEIFKRLAHLDRLIVTSLVGRAICENNNLKASYVLTTKELYDSNILFTYFVRILKALSLRIGIRDKDIIYSTSDFLTDTFPAFIWKLRNRKANWVICVFLLVPTLFKDYSRGYSKANRFSMPSIKRTLYYLSQQLTMFLGRRWADQILVLNEMDKGYLVNSRGVAGSKISVVEGGVDYSHLKSLKGKKSEVYDGIFLGRFHSQKGIFDLIKIWKLVCKKKPEARLCVIGGGPQSLVQKVKESIKKENLYKNIDLVGPKTGDEKFLLLKSGSVFLCPSYYESFAIVIAEAMACGLPVVAYDLAIYNDIYEEHILKVPSGDVSKFADAVIHLLSNGKLRKSLGFKGQEFVQKYDWGRIAKKEYKIMTQKDY